MVLSVGKRFMLCLTFAVTAMLMLSTAKVYAEDFTVRFDIEGSGTVNAIINSTDTRWCTDNGWMTVSTQDIVFIARPDDGWAIQEQTNPADESVSALYTLNNGDDRAMTASDVSGGGKKFTLSNIEGNGSGTFKVKFARIFTVSIDDDIDSAEGVITLDGASSGTARITAGGSQAYTVTPKTGWKIVSVNGVNVLNDGEVYHGTLTNINSDVEMTAVFAKRIYNVTFKVKDGQNTVGGMSISYNGHNYAAPATVPMVYGETAQLTSIVAGSDSLYLFSKYTTDKGTLSAATTASSEYTAGGGNATVTAEFVKEYIKVSFNVGKNGSIKYTGTGGTVIVNSDVRTSYKSATDFTFTATPSSSLYIVGDVTYTPDGGTPTQLHPNNGIYTVPKSLDDGTLKVTFNDALSYKITVKEPPEKNCYLTVKADGVKLTAGTHSVPANASISVKASTDKGSGYLFDYIAINDVLETSADNYSISTLTGDVTIAAVFEEVDTYKLTISANKGGEITQSGGLSTSDTTVQVNKGDRVTFKVSPDSGYKINNISYTGSSLSQSGSSYTTSKVTKDATLNVEFISRTDGVLSVDVDKDGNTVVSMKSVDDAIELVNSYSGCILKAPMSLSGVVDTDVLTALKGKNTVLRLVGSDYYWTIYGNKIKSNIFNANLTVTTGSIIDDRFLVPVSNYEDKTQFNIAYDGKLPFKAGLSVLVGEDNAGRYANLFYFNDEKFCLESRGCTIVDKYGYASYSFEHASDYVIVVADKQLSAGDLASYEGVEFVETSGFSLTDMSSLKTAALLLGVVLAVGAVIAVVLSRAGRAKEDEQEKL